MAASKVWTYFTGKSPNSKQTVLMKSLAGTLKANKYNLRTMVKALVKSDEYKKGALYTGKEG